MGTSSYHPSPDEKITYHNSRSTQDGHGGRAAEHHEEMRQIASEAIKEQVPAIAKQIYADTIKSMLNALQYDIETVVNISFDDAHDIFTSKKARKYVSDKITQEIIKRLNDMPDITIQ